MFNLLFRFTHQTFHVTGLWHYIMVCYYIMCLRSVSLTHSLRCLQLTCITSVDGCMFNVCLFLCRITFLVVPTFVCWKVIKWIRQMHSSILCLVRSVSYCLDHLFSPIATCAFKCVLLCRGDHMRLLWLLSLVTMWTDDILGQGHLTVRLALFTKFTL